MTTVNYAYILNKAFMDDIEVTNADGSQMNLAGAWAKMRVVSDGGVEALEVSTRNGRIEIRPESGVVSLRIEADAFSPTPGSTYTYSLTVGRGSAVLYSQSGTFTPSAGTATETAAGTVEKATAADVAARTADKFLDAAAIDLVTADAADIAARTAGMLLDASALTEIEADPSDIVAMAPSKFLSAPGISYLGQALYVEADLGAVPDFAAVEAAYLAAFGRASATGDIFTVFDTQGGGAGFHFFVRAPAAWFGLTAGAPATLNGFAEPI